MLCLGCDPDSLPALVDNIPPVQYSVPSVMNDKIIRTNYQVDQQDGEYSWEPFIQQDSRESVI